MRNKSFMQENYTNAGERTSHSAKSSSIIITQFIFGKFKESEYFLKISRESYVCH